MGPAGTIIPGVAAACLLAVVAAMPAASAQAAATLGVPPVCLVSATGASTMVTKEMCGIELPAGTTLTPALPKEYKVGTHRITWNGLTDAGLRMDETQVIIVMDLSPPDLAPPPAVLGHEATGKTTEIPTRLLGMPTITDAYKGIVAPTYAVTTKPFPVGVHKIPWSATDSAGLASTTTQVLEIVDTTPPTIACNDDIFIHSSTQVPRSLAGLNLGATFSDIVDGTKALTPPAATPDPIPLGRTTITHKATDSSGNKAECTQNVYASTPSTLATLPTASGVEGDTYGKALALGKNTLFVGNPERTEYPTAPGASPLINSGIVHAYRLTEGTGQYTEYTIKPKTPATNLYFGSALAVITTDDGEVLAVGAYGRNNNVGEVSLHNPATGALLKTIPNPNSNTDPKTSKRDHFGAVLASMGDKLVVGAYEYDKPSEPATPTTPEKPAVLDVGRVYVYDSGGAALYEIPAYSDTANGRFGSQVEATDDGETERVYVGSRTDGETGAVYVYDVTGASKANVPGPSLKALRPSGFALTEFGTKQIRPASGGGVYVGEPGAGKIHHYVDSTRSELTPQLSRTNMFGSAFGVDGRLLYAGTHTPGTASPLQAFRLADHAYANSYISPAATSGDYYHARFGYRVEASDRWVAATDILERFGESGDVESKTRVRVLDLRTLDPDLTYSAPSAPAPETGPQTQPRAQQSAPHPAQATTTQAPRLLSTEPLGTDKLRLTYDVAIDPFEVDADDYVLSDASLEVVAATVSKSTVTLTFVGGTGGPPARADAAPLGVERVGGIGYY